MQKAEETLAKWKKDNSAPVNVGGHEIHIFFLPIDPSDEQREAFIAACIECGVKPLCLSLDFKGDGMHTVMQTSNWYKGDIIEALEAAVESAKKLDAILAPKGIELVRIKHETLAQNQGVPVNDNDIDENSGYFEYHVKVKCEPNKETDELLKKLGYKLTNELGFPVPFSCNDMRPYQDNKGNDIPRKTQRFLNLRTRGIGSQTSEEKLSKVIKAINANGFETTPMHSEYIAFDTNVALDRGFLEF